MKSDIPPFYSGETVVGRVVGLAPRFATIKVCGRIVPLEVAFMDWNALRTADEALSIGDRVEAVVYTGNRLDEFHQRRWMWPKQVWNGAWLNRLPLLDDPWPRLMEKYSDGSVVEVEMVDYVNWYIARARLPDGLIIELRTGDIHLKTKRGSEFLRTLHPGERFKIVFRRVYRPGWVQRFMGGSIPDCLGEAGYLSPLIADALITDIEKSYVRKRDGNFAES